ncbi:MAG: hypothetical protein FGM61_05110 [Sediminibacterium sp.]|nr:hypothetical protein [Sediminibacterium sp.]
MDSGRTLNEKEKQIISEVFQNSVNTEIIRLIELPFWSKHCFVLHNYIFIPHNVTSISNSLLVHEVVHIWQFRQEGCSYIFNALAAQIRYGRKNIPGNAYDWTTEIKRGKTDWQDFNKEAAAQFIEDLWKEGAACIYTNKGNCEIIEEGNGVFFRIMHEGTSISNIASPIMISKRDSQNYSAIAFRAVNQLQSMKS